MSFVNFFFFFAIAYPDFSLAQMSRPSYSIPSGVLCMQQYILYTVAQWASQMAAREVKTLPASVGGLKRCGFD